MAANTRTKAQRAVDLERLSEMFYAGKSQATMAKEIGVSQQQISHDLKTLDKAWQAALGNWGEHKARELAKLNRLESHYQSAWERSCRDADADDDDDDGEKKAKKRDGNPAFLAGVMSCIQERIKLLRPRDEGPEGTDVTVNVQTNVASVGPGLDVRKLSIEELELLADLKRRIANRLEKPGANGVNGAHDDHGDGGQPGGQSH